MICPGLLVLTGALFTGPQEPTPPEPPAPAAEWRQYRGNSGQQGVAAGNLADELEFRWTYDVGKAIASSPVVAGGIVYFGADDQKIHAVDGRTGEAVWTFETEDMVEAPPTVVGDLVVIGSNDFFVYGLDRLTGELRWKFEGGDKFIGAAVPVEGPGGEQRVVIGCYDTNLYCLDVEDGSEVWAYTTDNYVNGTPAVDEEGRIVFGGCDAVLHVVSARTGEALSRLELGEACHVAGSTAIESGRAYFGHYGNAFVSVDLDDQKVIWEYTDPNHAFFSSPAILEDRVIFGGRDRELHCVNKETGEELWSFKTRRKVDSSPVACDGKVVFGSGDGWLHMLRVEDGESLWSYEIGRSILGSPAVVGGEVLIGANDGRLYCFGSVEDDQSR